MIDFFCFQSGLVTLGMIDNSGTRHARSCLIIAARERPRAGSKQMAMYQAVVAQTQSRWSSSCERTSPRRPSWSLSTLGSKHACDRNRRSSVTHSSISASSTPPHPLLTHYEIRCIYNQEYFLEKKPWVVRDGPRCSDCAPDEIFQGNVSTPPAPKFLGKISS